MKYLLIVLVMLSILGCDKVVKDTAPRLARVILVERPMPHMDNDIREYTVIEIIGNRQRHICRMALGEVGDEFMVRPTQCHYYEGWPSPAQQDSPNETTEEPTQ